MASIGPVSISTGSTADQAGVDDPGPRPRGRAPRPSRRWSAARRRRRRRSATRCRRCGRRPRGRRASAWPASRAWSRAGPRRGRRGGCVPVGLPSSSRSGASTGDDLGVEAALGPGLRRPAAGTRRPNASVSSRVMPHFSAMRSAPSNCDVNSYCGEVGLGDRPCRVALAEFEPDRHPAHDLDAAGDGDVDDAGADQAGGEVGGLLGRAALAVDGGGGHRERQAGGQPGGAGDVEGLLADLADAAADDLADLGRVDAGALDQLLLRRRPAGRRGGWWTGRRRAARRACGRLRRSRRRSWPQRRADGSARTWAVGPAERPPVERPGTRAGGRWRRRTRRARPEAEVADAASRRPR